MKKKVKLFSLIVFLFILPCICNSQSYKDLHLKSFYFCKKHCKYFSNQERINNAEDDFQWTINSTELVIKNIGDYLLVWDFLMYDVIVVSEVVFDIHFYDGNQEEVYLDTSDTLLMDNDNNYFTAVGFYQSNVPKSLFSTIKSYKITSKYSKRLDVNDKRVNCDPVCRELKLKEIIKSF